MLLEKNKGKKIVGGNRQKIGKEKMKISKHELKKIILEELKNVLNESDLSNIGQDVLAVSIEQGVGAGLTRVGLSRGLVNLISRGLGAGLAGILVPSGLADATLAGAAKRMPQQLGKWISKHYPDLSEDDVNVLVPKVMAYNLLKHKKPGMIYLTPSPAEMGKIIAMDAEDLKKQIEDLPVENNEYSLNEQQDFIPADQIGDELIKMIMKHGKGKVGYEVAKKIFDHLLNVLSPQGQPIGMDRKQLELAVQGLIKDPSKMP